MVGTSLRRRFIVSVKSIALVASIACVARGQDPKTKSPDKPPNATSAVAPGDDLVAAFVPKNPRTVQERERIESLQEYIAARALEDRRQWTEAIDMYEKALKREPDSIAVLRRLNGLCFALGRTEQAVAYGQRVLEAEPGDVKTLTRLVGYFHDRKRDPKAAEAVLRKALENPKLEKTAAGYLLIQRYLGDIYGDRLNQPEKAADAYAKVLDGLDEKAANRLALADQRQILHGDEAESYTRFGEAFLKVKKYDLAVQAFQRGLAHESEHPRLPLLAARALLESGKGAEALKTLDTFIRRQPQGLEPYDLLGRIYDKLDRSKEFLPRLEEAAKADSKNVALQYALADAYRKNGEPDKAEEKLKSLLASGASDPQILAGLASAFLRAKKYEEVVKLLGDALAKPALTEGIQPVIGIVAADPEAGALLDAGIALMTNKPAEVSRTGRVALLLIANQSKKQDKFVAIQRQILKLDPNPQSYKEFFTTLTQLGEFGEAATALEEMIEKYPAEKTDVVLSNLARTRARARAVAGQNQQALSALEDALKLDPNDVDALLLKGMVLGKIEKNDEAIKIYQDILKRFPDAEEIFKICHSRISGIYVTQNKLAEGERELEICLEKFPDDAGVNNDLGYLYADQGKQLEKAEAMIRKAVEEEPNNTAYLDSLGWVLFKRDKYKDAIAPLEKAAAASDTDATIHDHLGDVYYSLKDSAKAKNAWERAEKIAAKNDPPDKILPEVRKKLQYLKERGIGGKPGDNP
jgi:tetratricopeptide (TPR) repeat protein